jgi:GNAT superfamily N-acetyltransferase
MPPCSGAVHLRRATENDAPAMAQIQVRASRSAFKGLLPDDLLVAVADADHERAWRREIAMLPEELRPSVADIDGRLVGFIGATPSDESPGDPPHEHGSELNVFVDPECWAQGIARRLVEHQVRLLRRLGRTDVSTWILVGDARAQAFCEAMGWHADGTRRPRRLGTATADEVRYRAAR